MLNSKQEKNECSGCGACFNICPVKAIKMNPDIEGFEYPVIDSKICIDCKKCMKVCPYLNITKPYDTDKKVYAAWSLNEEARSYSTSGGLFFEFAIKILNENGYVCGAGYGKDFLVYHNIISENSDLKNLMQSKYIQSNVLDAFFSIGNVLKEKNKLLFCGTPCQCNGLVNYLDEEKIERSNLYIIDFICRGVNSPKVYKKFLNELEKIYNSKVKNVWFKNKTFGWNRFSTKIDFENGSKYLKDRYSDVFIRGFIEKNLYIRPSCSNCMNKGEKRFSDITLGDFWGIKLNDAEKDTNLGTSAVIINTEKGIELLSKIKERIFIENKKIEDVTKKNPHYYDSVRAGEDREKFMENIDTLNTVENIKSFLN